MRLVLRPRVPETLNITTVGERLTGTALFVFDAEAVTETNEWDGDIRSLLAAFEEGRCPLSGTAYVAGQ